MNIFEPKPILYPIKNLLIISFTIVLITVTASTNSASMDLLGAGATFPYPLYSKMFYTYWQKTGIKINYQAIGSGGGQRQLLNRTVDFGGSDSFMGDEALAKAPAEILHIPTCLGAVVVTYNLQGHPALKFTQGLVADIFLGKITRWNDRRISRINPDRELPDRDIILVYRSDGSGTTFLFTDYLSKVSDQWEKRVGRGKAVNWPVGLGAKGNPGVAGVIKYLPGAIGYLELGYALLNRLPVAVLRNRSGRFIEPSGASASIAAGVPVPDDTRITITDTEAPEGYPISGFTWVLVYKEQAYGGRSGLRAEALSKALWWMTHEGQKYARPLHYAPLPSALTDKAEKIIGAISFKGRPLR